MENVIKRIHDYSLEDIMEKSFSLYAKTIIQDRAIPDVRDGLKPVQRRILYSMYKDGNTYEKPTRKSAKAVGNIMGQYHPHGDSSIYDALVRMSQWWKNNSCFIEMQGNNGSIDGDSAAAMRYTEARLSKISNELLKDINKETVAMSLNYDDTLLEPVVLPAKFPNLLVNGAMGISAGYATNIPPHNLGEVIDATIKRIDSPNCQFDTILDIIKGPDFPMGGIAEGIEGIKQALKTGRGKVIIKSKFTVEKIKNRKQIVITEIPYEVNKLLLVKRIDEIRIDKKIEGIVEVRDESDKDVRIVIDLKKDANDELVINYLLKNTDMMVSYSYNIVAIKNRRPMTLGVLEILDAYIEHQKDVVTKRTEFDLRQAEGELHIIEGLIKALSILDEVIKTIRASKNKSNAIDNLQKEFDFTEKQATAIVNLQLYKLTNTDVTELESKMEELKKNIAIWTRILENEEALKHVMKTELRLIKKEYATPRKTEIKNEVTEIKIDTTELIPSEDCVVVITKDGYVKRVSLRSYNKEEETTIKEGDNIIGIYQINTLDTILLFTDLGNYLYVPVHEIPETKWKELGKHISNLISIKSEESIVKSIPVYQFDENIFVTTFTKNGIVKRSSLKDYQVQRYSKPISGIKLKAQDEVIDVTVNFGNEVFISTKQGYGLWYETSEIPITGVKSSGVKSINLKNDEVVSAHIFDDMEYLTIITEKNTGKRIKFTEFIKTSRAKRGTKVIREVKTNPYYIKKTFIENYKEILTYQTKDDKFSIKLTELPITDRLATGTNITKEQIIDIYIEAKLISKDMLEEIKTIPQEKENIPLDSIDKRFLTIDDFLDDFESNN